MELNYLNVFYEVAKAGRFSEAARRLNISQSALSRSVALLEESEGVRLFERSKRGVKLTPTGEEVFRHCEEIFQTVHRISRLCRGSNEVCEGPLRFTTTDHIANYLLVEPIRDLRHQYPGVLPSIRIGMPDEIVDSLHESEDEFALLFAKVASPQIEYEALREEPMALVVQTSLWRDNRGASHSLTLNRLVEKAGYISSVGAHARSRQSRVLKELFGRVPRIACEVDGQEAQKRICISGGGMAYLSRFMVQAEIASGQLHEIEVEEPHTFNLWLARRKGKAPSLPAQRFIELLRQKAT